MKAPKPATAQCCKRIYTGARWDMTGHQCGIKASVLENGKWYCKRHSPSAESAKRAEREANFQATMAASDAATKKRIEDGRRAAAYPRLVEALRDALQAIKDGKDVGCIDHLDAWDEAEAMWYARIDNANALLRKLGELE